MSLIRVDFKIPKYKKLEKVKIQKYKKYIIISGTEILCQRILVRCESLIQVDIEILPKEGYWINPVKRWESLQQGEL